MAVMVVVAAAAAVAVVDETNFLKNDNLKIIVSTTIM